MDSVVFGMPLSTALTVTFVPLAITAGLVLWGLTYKPSGDQTTETK